MGKQGITAFIALFISSASFGATQNLKCHFLNASGTSDVLLITLASNQGGTLVYHSGNDETDPNSDEDGSLALKRTEADLSDLASFATQTEAMQMTFRLPMVALAKPGTEFKGILSTRIKALKSSQDQDVSCSP